MSISCEHKCDTKNCGKDIADDECFCGSCMDDACKNAYKEGHRDGLKEAKDI